MGRRRAWIDGREREREREEGHERERELWLVGGGYRYLPAPTSIKSVAWSA